MIEKTVKLPRGIRLNTFYGALKLKLTLICMVALLAVIAVVHVGMYLVIKNIVSDQIGRSARSVAVSIAAHLMEDVEGYREFVETRDVNSEYYRRAQKYFARIKTSSPLIKYIFTERRLDVETVEYLLDAAPVPGDDYEYPSPPGETTFMDEATRAVYATRQPALLPPTTHPVYGTLLGGCAPIFDGNGDMLGVAGVNFDISQMFSQLDRLQYSMLILYLFIMLAVFFLLNKYSGAILDPMIKDKTTGAYSKRYYEPLLRLELKNADRNGTETALLMLDLDHFKRVNDTHGHGFGDTVLTVFSRTVMRCLRSDDYFIRCGGEEFAVILADVDAAAAMQIAERIRRTVEKTDIYNEELGHAVRVTVSIGAAYSSTASRRSDRELTENADKALYNAKATRNAVLLFAPGGGAVAGA